MKREDSIGDRLRTAGLRRTPVRLAVLRLISESRKPLGAVDLLKRLDDETDQVTVYRTLNTLVEHKLVHRVRGEDGAWRYAAEAQRPHSHAHFVCDACGGVECLEAIPVPEDLRLGRKYEVSYAELVVHGTCPRCRG